MVFNLLQSYEQSTLTLGCALNGAGCMMRVPCPQAERALKGRQAGMRRVDDMYVGAPCPKQVISPCKLQRGT